MNKKYLLIFVFAIVFTLMLPNISLLAASSTQDDFVQAQKAGQAFIDGKTNIIPEWQGAFLTTGQKYHNLEGQLNAYLFSINKDDKSIGRVVVGSKDYGYDIFEAGFGSVPQLPTLSELQLALTERLALKSSIADIKQSQFVYLGYDNYNVIYDVKGQQIAFNLRTRDVVYKDELSEKLLSPNEYYSSKNSYSLKSLDSYLYYELDVPLEGQYDSQIPSNARDMACAPTSGAMVAEYYKYYRSYSNFYAWVDDFDALYISMQTSPTTGTLHTMIGPGFEDYASDCGYDFEVDYSDAINDDYDYIQNYINSDQPLMILFGLVPYTSYSFYHVCALKGYYYDTQYEPPYIIVNNPGSASGYEDFVNWTANYDDSKIYWIDP